MKDKKAFWHRLPDWKIRKMIEKGTSIGFVLANYRQPTWCGYPDALAGTIGCWSLTDNFGLRKKISKQFCSGCDCCTLLNSDKNPERSVANTLNQGNTADQQLSEQLKSWTDKQDELDKSPNMSQNNSKCDIYVGDMRVTNIVFDPNNHKCTKDGLCVHKTVGFCDLTENGNCYFEQNRPSSLSENNIDAADQQTSDTGNDHSSNVSDNPIISVDWEGLEKDLWQLQYDTFGGLTVDEVMNRLKTNLSNHIK